MTSYFEFTLTPQAGLKFDLENIQFDFGAGGTSTPRSVRVRYSFDDGATFTTAGDATAPTVTSQYQRFTFALSDQNVALNETTSPVRFRFLVAVPTTGNDIRMDNLTINGSAIPEPATAGICVLAGATTLLRRRRAVRIQVASPRSAV